MKTIGFECEFFSTDEKGNVVMVPTSIPHDDCGYQFEARSMPFEDVYEAVGSLRTDIRRIFRAVEEYNKTHSPNIFVSHDNIKKIPRDVTMQVRRVFSKGVHSFENLYGFTDHKQRRTEAQAGLHISFKVTRDFSYENGRILKETPIWDFVSTFRKLDAAFADEIKKAKRNPGFYELKPDGRIEYRSLPNNVNLDKVEAVLSSILKG